MTRILVMDDQESIRTLLTLLLDQIGLVAECTSNGEEALTRFSQMHPDPGFKAAILDLTVPGEMDGLEAARAIRALDPLLPVYIMTGYWGLMPELRANGINGVLEKPFTLLDLERILCTARTSAGVTK